MHTFTPRWVEAWRQADEPSLFDQPYRSATDLVDHAERDRLTLWRTWPEVWHLDSDGWAQCGSAGGSGDSVRSMADSPGQLLGCRLELVPGCPDNWVVLEHRAAWQRTPMDPSDTDVDAFLRLRAIAADAGVTLLDVVVVTDALQWWSLDEMATGATDWTFDVAPQRRGRTSIRHVPRGRRAG